MDTRLIVIAAVGDNDVIGCEGKLPWHLAADMQRFKTLTTGHTVIMGRNTWESLPAKFRPLPDRLNIVLSRQKDYEAPGAHVFKSLNAALEVRLGPVIFVIGGQQVYEKAIWKADEVHLTRVHAEPHGDAWFPADALNQRFTMTDSGFFRADDKNDHDYNFAIYHKVLPAPGYVNLANARKPQQWAVMERILLDGVCPFCPEYLSRYHHEPAIAQTERWTLTKNQWAYENTKVHLMAIHRHHVVRLAQLDSEDWSELGKLLRLAERIFDIRSGGIGIRFGEPSGNGGTVSHLHVQLLSAAQTDTASPDYKPVRLRLG
jgi:dihydrofolate reductase